MRQVIAFLLSAMLQMNANSLLADERPVVVELFTSQGCSSCPSADAFLKELAQDGSVLALAMHVDYWDYIGWKDTFAKPLHTLRQQGYAEAAGRQMIYTPQMIINGTKAVIGTRKAEVLSLINALKVKNEAPGEGAITLDARRQDGVIHLRAQTIEPRAAPVLVEMIRYDPEEAVEIGRGENAGRKITYTNIVTEITPLAEWDTRQPLALDVPCLDSEPVVILLQESGFGPILAAAHFR